MASNLTAPRSGTSPKSQPAVAKGNLSKKITVNVSVGEILQLKETLNTMVDQLQRPSPAR